MTRYFALIVGISDSAVGILGVIPVLHTAWPADAPDLAVENGYGYLIGIFPNNILHTLLHLAIGIWGITAHRSFGAARIFSRGVALIYGMLAIIRSARLSGGAFSFITKLPSTVRVNEGAACDGI